VSQRTSSACGLFSRAEDKVKLSDDEIEEAFTIIAAIGRGYILRARKLAWLSHGLRGKGGVPSSIFILDSHPAPNTVHMNMKARLFRLWARISRRLTGKLELKLWTRRSTR
jgi:hypothetical protein